MPNWKKIIVSGSSASLSSLTVTNQVTASSYTGSFSGSFTGDGSDLTGIDTGSTFPYTGSADILGELNLTANGNNFVDNDYVDGYLIGNPALTANDSASFLDGAEFSSKDNDYVSDYAEDYLFGGRAITVYDNAVFSGSVLSQQFSGSLSGSFEGTLDVQQLRLDSGNEYVDNDYIVVDYIGGIALITTGSAIIEGGATIKGSLLQEGGSVVLTKVSESFNFTNDTDAANGGVPLGGLYRNGNDIKIRIT